MPEYFGQFFCDSNDRYSVIVEDDGRIAYAYLLLDEEITGDVWLYNQVETPMRFDTTGEMPFLNPADFIQKNIEPIVSADDMNTRWFLTNDVVEVEIYIKNKFIARLTDKSKPGWSTMVKMDGPLAKVLKSDTVSS